MKLTDKVPAYENKARWQAIDDCTFFLTMEGMLTLSESDRARQRLLRRARKEGFVFKQQSESLPPDTAQQPTPTAP